ncbi:MAG: type II secretion system protein [Acidimicrobiales bacterium]|nr:MAG: type II secretion system protein [Acidimicrobiales bacterium]
MEMSSGVLAAEAQEIFGVVGLAGAIGLIVWLVGSQVEERAAIRESLQQLEGYEVESIRDQELLKPLRERALLPILERLTNLGRRFTPVGYVDSVRQKFILAGEVSADAVDRFLARRVITIALVPVVIFVMMVWNPLGLTGTSLLAVTGLLIVALVLGPDSSLSKKVEARQKQLQRQLPDVLDLLTISVEAGLGFEQALDRTVAAVPGALAEEFARLLGEIRAGASRAEALRALEQRTNVPEVRSFVLAIIQADTFGVSIGRVLRAQAEEMRVKRRQLAQEEAQKAPVKMIFPMVFCIFPSLFVVVLGPAIINIRETLG